MVQKLLYSVRVLATFLLLVAVLFIPAGRLDYWEGWAFFGFYLLYCLAWVAWLRFRDPALLAERTQKAENVKLWDRVLMGIYFGFFFAMLVVAGLDAGRYQWAVTPLVARVIGWAALALTGALIFWVMETNTFLSASVRIQEERGHRVITEGPYRIVRHPMYVGVILFALSTPVVLGSWWALVPAAGIAVLFVVRTALEDRTLQEELPGYREYASRVRYRLLPAIW